MVIHFDEKGVLTDESCIHRRISRVGFRVQVLRAGLCPIFRDRYVRSFKQYDSIYLF